MCIFYEKCSKALTFEMNFFIFHLLSSSNCTSIPGKRKKGTSKVTTPIDSRFVEKNFLRGKDSVLKKLNLKYSKKCCILQHDCVER